MEVPVAGPVAGADYPRNWTEFLDWFGSEEACLSYLLMCRDCGRQSTVTAGTLFDKTRTPLRVWLAAAWYLTNQKQGVSALGLQRVLGLGSYQTAWTMLHRFRRAMVRPGRERLKGQVRWRYSSPRGSGEFAFAASPMTRRLA